MAKTRSAQLLRVAVVTGFMAVLTVGSLVTVIWTVLTTSDNGFDVFGILLLTAAGNLLRRVIQAFKTTQCMKQF
jgi:hypothetical protein